MSRVTRSVFDRERDIARVKKGRVEHHIGVLTAEWSALADRSPVDGLPIGALRSWIMRDFAQADYLASRFRRRHNLSSYVVFFVPPLAVLLGFIGYLFYRSSWGWPAIEFGLLGVNIVVLILARRGHVHRKSIYYRCLAERLRSLYFTSFVPSTARVTASEPHFDEDPSERAIAEIIASLIARRPELPEIDAGYEAHARSYLVEAWIEQQVKYHVQRSHANRQLHRFCQGATYALFGTAILVAGVHAYLVSQQIDRAESFVVLFAIAAPIAGGILHGWALHREYERNADRYHRMADLLRHARTEMRCAESPSEVAADVDRLIREENTHWFGVMRFHDVELVV